MSASKLFQPTKVGRMTLQHRIVFAPLTRNRVDSEGVPILPIVADYYAQRASTPGTFLIAEGTIIAPEACGMDNFPGIWSDEQIASWKKVSLVDHTDTSTRLQLCADTDAENS